MGEDVCTQCLDGQVLVEATGLGFWNQREGGQPLQSRKKTNLGVRGRPGLVLPASSPPPHHTHTDKPLAKDIVISFK